MDIAKIASRIAAHPTTEMKFTGTIWTENDGENNAGYGTLEFEGKQHKFEFQANQGVSQYKLDGELLEGEPDAELIANLDEFFSTQWPDESDHRWEEPSTPEPEDDETGKMVIDEIQLGAW